MANNGNAAPRVLVVDDERDLLIVIKTVLRARGGFDVHTCPNSSDAVAMSVELRPDLILLDFMMPVMSGEETLATLRANAETENIPVVFMTARHDLPDEVLNQQNVLGVIGKPFDQRTLADELRAFLDDSGHDTSGATADPTVSELLEKYRADLPTRIQELEAAWSRALTEKDERALQEAIAIAHRLSGTGATFGFPEVSASARSIEAAMLETTLDNPNVDTISSRLASLRDAATP